jgi:polysaccharide deacetylase family protein (PEP-CTERM system associated)
MKNLLTIDLEDWYQGIELDTCEWGRCDGRIEYSTHKLLKILEDENVKATFFVLGNVAENCPHLVKEISSLGHEIGTHGYGHELIYKTNPDEFASSLRKSIHILEDITGTPVKGHRAPYFSITNKSLWALDVLAENGIHYDSSIFPINNYRYGIPDAPRFPYNIKTQNGSILEIPISTVKMLGRNLSFTGGFYLRFFPYFLIKQAIQKINREGHPAVVYLHPWELDPEHPRLDLPLRIRLTHYHNLSSTERKLRTLLQDFDFGPAMNIMNEVIL